MNNPLILVHNKDAHTKIQYNSKKKEKVKKERQYQKYLNLDTGEVLTAIEACNKYNIKDRSSVRNAATNHKGQKTAGGYRWKKI